MASAETITIASLGSIIGLFFLKLILNSKGFKFNCSNTLFSISARVGQASPTFSIEDAPPRRESFPKRRSQSAP